MIAANAYRLLKYQAGKQSSAPQPRNAPQPSGVLPKPADVYVNASLPTVQIQQQLLLIQQQAQAVMSQLQTLQQQLGSPASIGLPTVELPSVALPSLTLPSLDLPAANLPSIELPPVALPSLELPAPAPAPAPAPPTPNKPAYGQPWQPGPGQLQGADTSHWQSEATFDKTIANAKWSAIKASQGTGYVDPTFKARWNKLGKKIEQGEMKLRMAYCFLDPGNGKAQAKHFLDVVGVHGKLPAGTRLALDWEGPALNSPETLRDAANYIHEVTGLWPVIYASESRVPTVKKYVPEAPLWVANWSEKPDPNVPFVQYADGPVYDHDVFNGNEQALARFAGLA